MKYIAILFVLLLPALVSAQTPSLYDEWTPIFEGGKAHIVITKDMVTATTMPKSGSGMSQFLTVPMETTSEIQQESSNDIAEPKIERTPLLRVIYDSGRAKGRMFIQEEKSKTIITLTFLLHDDGELSLGFGFADKQTKSLRTAIRNSLKPSKNSWFGDLKVSLFNKACIDRFEKLKDPADMPKDEALGMIRSFGDRLAALLQQDKEDPGILGGYGILFGKGQRVINEVFTAHGYNPLGMQKVVDKFKDDEDVKASLKTLETKIEESVPALRELKHLRENAPASDSTMNPALKEIPAAPAPRPPAEEYHGGTDRMEKVKQTPREVSDESHELSKDDFVDGKVEKTPVQQTDNQKLISESQKEPWCCQPIVEPKPKKNIQAMLKYPEDAKISGIEGKVTFSALISKNGKVEKVVIEKTDNEIFNQAVIDAVKKIRFSPAFYEGKPTKVWYTQSVNFKLN